MQHPLQQQLALAGIEPIQPAVHPALVLAFATERLVLPLMLSPARLRPLPGRQAIQQRAAPLLPFGGGGIEAAQPQGLVQLQCLAPALARAAQGSRQLLLPQGRQLKMLALLLQVLAAAVQLAQLAGAAQGMAVIAQVVLHRPADVGHRKAAQGGGARRIEGLDRPDQPKAAQLHQVVERHCSARALAHGHPAHQGQIQLHQPVAQAVVAAAAETLQQLGIEAAQVLVLMGLGA